MQTKDFKVVNKSVTKIDAMSLALGKPSYVADFKPEDTLYVKMLWSPHAHARITSIDISAAEKMPGVAGVLYHGNVPRVPHCTAGQGYPEPSPYDTFMFDTKVRYVGDRVAAVAAESPEIAEAAVKAIKVEYELLEPVLSIDAALKEGAPIIHDEPDCSIPIPVPYEPEKNIVARLGMEAGDFDAGMAAADFTFDHDYETPYAQHCPMETYVAMAQMDARDRLVITSSTQVPFHTRRLLALTLQIPVRRIRVIKPRIGGAFGSKQEFLLEDVIGMFALRTRRTVFWQFDRQENFRTGRTRHPIRFRIRSGVKKDGAITAMGMDAVSNTGAYGGHGLTVIGCCGSKVLPLYHCDNIHFDTKVVYTNLPVGGAYRGFGATQAFFAVEQQMDMMAEAIGMDPIAFRQRNHIKVGESSPVFAALGEGKEGVPMTIGSCGLGECITQGADAIDWSRYTPHTEKTGRYRRGLGMCCLMQGSSVPLIDMGSAHIKMNDDGSFNLHIGATDLGTGSDTILGQIAAEQLGVGIDKMIVYSSDTDMTPFDVGAYASSTTYLSGEATRKAAEKVFNQICQVGAEMLDLPVEEVVSEDEEIRAKDGSGSVSYADIALYSLYEKNQFQIQDTASHITHKSPPPFAAHFVEIEVDTFTGHVKLLKYVATVDCGTAINPKLAEGQTEGGVMNGISYALTEEYLFDEKGKMTNASLQHYHIFSLRDKPEMKTILVPSYEDTGPFGAKSVSEICINGAAPAIGNAIYNAIGVRMYSFPFTRERVWNAMREQGFARKS
ncbi:MAG: aldehyde oxidase [Spartobacteria bacterium]|nr:aldehyde oxidase [Spartobacteria bacterium]